jgi:hypothetical protein
MVGRDELAFAASTFAPEYEHEALLSGKHAETLIGERLPTEAAVRPRLP